MYDIYESDEIGGNRIEGLHSGSNKHSSNTQSEEFPELVLHSVVQLGMVTIYY